MGGMDTEKVAQETTEAEAQVFIAENEPLLERATPVTLHRIILHGGEIATRLSDEVVAEMNETARVLNEAADAICDDATSPTRIQELEEECMRVRAQESTKQETLEALDDVMQRAMTLRKEREADVEVGGRFAPGDTIDVGERLAYRLSAKPEQPKRPFWQRLFGGR
jgi:hypothetical protein